MSVAVDEDVLRFDITVNDAVIVSVLQAVADLRCKAEHINGDTDEDAIQKAIDKHKITWRSFQDKRPGKESISEEWNALYPTLFLIDHKGIFRKRCTGAPPIDVLNRMVDELVADAKSELPDNN